MTQLIVYAAADASKVLLDTTDFDAIVSELEPTGAAIERWTAATPLSAEATSEEILDAYKPQIDRLKSERRRDSCSPGQSELAGPAPEIPERAHP